MSDDCDTRENVRNKDFYLKQTRMEEENFILREEMTKLDERNLLLERQHAYLKRQLEQIHKKYSELQREHDERKVTLDEVMKQEKMVNVSLKQSMKERQVLSTKLEAAELKAQEVATLKEKLTKLTNEKSESMKKIIDMIEKLDEKHNECESLRRTVTELEETNERLWKNCETHENILRVLRQENRELVDENTELKSLIDINVRLSTDKPTTPNSDGESHHMLCTPYESDGAFQQDSLYDELKASGFTSTNDEDDTTNRLLKDQMDWYEPETYNLLKQTENIFERLVSICGEKRVPLCVTQSLEYIECSETLQNFEKLGRRIQILLDMVTTIPFKVADVGREIGTQVRADSGGIEDLREFSVFINFYDRLQYPFPQDITIVRCDSSDNKQDPFLSAKVPKMKIVPESSIIDPIVKALDEIVQRTANPRSSPRKQNSMESLSLNKYRCAHVRSDILYDDGDCPLQRDHTIARGSSKLIMKGKNSKSTKEKTKSNGHAFIKIKNSEECRSDEEQLVTTESTKNCTATIRKDIEEASSSYESHTYEIEKSDVANSRDIHDEMENSLEENNNNSLKSNSILNVCQNFKHKLVDPSKFDIVVEEERLRTPVSRTLANTFIAPSWRVFVSCGLIFILGFYTTKFILSMNKYDEAPCQWWSFEEILSGYFSIKNTGPPPI